ncbi:MAG: hypothetical protein INF91_09850 [Alphaproteobacteria bacterium]|nr:hypothetical protein [Alphaproteobacteria bacterium]
MGWKLIERQTGVPGKTVRNIWKRAEAHAAPGELANIALLGDARIDTLAYGGPRVTPLDVFVAQRLPDQFDNIANLSDLEREAQLGRSRSQLSAIRKPLTADFALPARFLGRPRV